MRKHFNKVAWVTGASSGIGEELCYELSEKGYDIILTARNLDKLKIISKKINTNSIIAEANVSSIKQIKEASKLIFKKYGTIDLCILNAGIYKSVDAKEIDSKIFLDHILVNYMGVINCLEIIVPRMIQSQNGKIIIISSAAGIRGLPKASAYGPTKSALNNLAQSIRYDLEPKGVSVQIINLWFVLTNLSPIDEHGLPGVISPKLAAKKIVKNSSSNKFEVIIPGYFMQKLLIYSKFFPENWVYKIIKKISGY